MSKPRALVTRGIFDEALEMMRETIEVDLWEDEMPPSRDLLLEKVKGVDGLLCLLTDKVDSELMDTAGPQLKVCLLYTSDAADE